jgi:hypothetical protein
MKWSKLKKEIEGRFAKSIQGRVEISSTRYTEASHSMSRGWVTFDGREIANFSTSDSVNRYGVYYNELIDSICASHAPVQPYERTPDQLVEKGEFSRFDFHEACWLYLKLSIDQALRHKNPVINCFAILDHRLGKRRLIQMDSSTLHPLVRAAFQIRLSVEGLRTVPVFELPPQSISASAKTKD